MTAARPLTLDDIADQRAYERERDAFRAQVIAAKKLRRISVGPVITLTFENRLTMRFQVQEMARAEKMVTDEQIQHELDVYNRLLPAPGELSATLFLELTTEEELRTWLPRLVGIERAVRAPHRPGRRRRGHLVHPGGGARVEPEPARDAPRPSTTSGSRSPPEQVEAFVAGPVTLAVNHPEYPEGLPGTPLSEATRAELADDLAGP